MSARPGAPVSRRVCARSAAEAPRDAVPDGPPARQAVAARAPSPAQSARGGSAERVVRSAPWADAVLLQKLPARPVAARLAPRAAAVAAAPLARRAELGGKVPRSEHGRALLRHGAA